MRNIALCFIHSNPKEFILKKLIIVMLCLGISISASVQANPSEIIQMEAMKLERMWWDQVKNVDMEGLKKTVSPNYQQVLNIGAQDRNQWLEIAKNLKIKDYEIGNLKATRSDNALIVSYTIVTKEFINGKELSNKPQYRLDVWQKTAAGWQVISHANLSPIP
jgi:hypothetical protein